MTDTVPGVRGGFPEIKPVDYAAPELGRLVAAPRRLQDLMGWARRINLRQILCHAWYLALWLTEVTAHRPALRMAGTAHRGTARQSQSPTPQRIWQRTSPESAIAASSRTSTPRSTAPRPSTTWSPAVEPRLWNMSTVLPIVQDTTIVAAGPSVQNVSLSGAVPVGSSAMPANGLKPVRNARNNRP